MKKQRDLRDSFFEPLVSNLLGNPNSILLTGDHGAFALDSFSETCPDRYINCGISEQNMVSVAAGLALKGFKVFVYGITPFVSLRVAEQLFIDVAAMELDVNIISVGGGFTYSTDGPTHHGLIDIGLILSFKSFRVLNCSSVATSEWAAQQAFTCSRPKFIRVEKDLCEVDSLDHVHADLGFREAILGDGDDILVITTGLMFERIRSSLSNELTSESKGLRILDIFDISGFNEQTLVNLCGSYGQAIYVEEHTDTGLYLKLCKLLVENQISIKMKKIVASSPFVYEYGSREFVLAKAGLDTPSINELLLSELRAN